MSDANRVRPAIQPGDLPELGADVLPKLYDLDTTVDPHATVAVIDAYAYPSLEADLATYRSMYHLPACTVASGCLTILNEQGKVSPVAPTNQDMEQDDWTIETALDVDMVSAACPLCKIMVIQADSDQTADDLFIAHQTAATMGADVISDSWGGPEDSYPGGVAQLEHYLMNPGIAQFVATGDYGYESEQLGPQGEGPDYPSGSPNVFGVGGTTVTTASGTTRGYAETAWSDGGSSCSSFALPKWQKATGTCANRMASDLSAAADEQVVVCNDGQCGIVGGTSAASPFVAATFALTGHADASEEFPYDHPEAFNDVTTGTNGDCAGALCTAGSGWDGPTGIGTPNGKVLLALSTDTSSGGGGGCAAGGTGTGTGALVVVGLAWVTRRRHGQRR